MTEAETTQSTTEVSGAAPAVAQEPMIPKHRLDEALREARQLREQVEMQGQLLTRVIPQNQPQAPQITPESLGLDAQTFEAFQKVAQATLAQTVAPEAQKLRHQNAFLANKLEEVEFLQNFGAEARKDLDKVRNFRARYAQQTGQHMPLEHAYEILQFREFQSQRRTARPAPATEAPAAQTEQMTYPGAQGTHAAPAQAPAAPMIPGEVNVDELEAQLEAQYFSRGQRI